MYGNNNDMQDFNNNMTGSYDNQNNGNNIIYGENTNDTYDYDQQNVNFSGFSDEQTGANKKLNKWLIIVPLIVLFVIIIILLMIVSANNKYTVKTKSVSIKIDETATIEITAKDKVKSKLKCSSDNEKVATVTDDCVVKGVSVGNTNIYVGKNGKKSKKVPVTVTTNKTELVLKESSASIEKGSSYQLEVKNVLKDDKFTWISSNEQVATVDQNGLVTAVHVGSANITVRESDGRKVVAKITVTGDEVLITAMTLTDQTIGIGEEVQLKPTVTPENALQLFTWESSKPSVATVDENGKVTGVGEGTTTITVTSHNGITATTKVTVDAKTATAVTLTGCTGSLKIGETLKLTATVTPSTASSSVTWSSSDSTVATVSGGSVRGVKTGSVTITASTKNGKSATCKIKIGNMAVTSIKMNVTSANLNVGATKLLSVSYTPSTAKNYYTAKWSTSNSKVATVNSQGLVTAKKAGTATITASAGGKKTTATIKVSATQASTLSITNCPSSSIVKGNTVQLGYKSDYSGAKVTWSTSNKSVATVSSGKVTAVADGSATITASTSNGVSAKCNITVGSGSSTPATGNYVMISGCKSSVTAGSTYTLTGSSSLSGTGTWKSNNTSIATVDSKGKVTTIKAGTVMISYTVSGKSSTCTTTVKQPSITTVNTDKDSYSVAKGSTVTVKISTNLSDSVFTNNYTTSDLQTTTSFKSGEITITESAVNKLTIKGNTKGSGTVYIVIGGKIKSIKVTVT